MLEIDAAEKTLAEFGFAGVETWLNEWLPQPNHDKLGTAQQAAEIAQGAAAVVIRCRPPRVVNMI